MSIFHGHFNVLVPQQFFDSEKISPVHDQVTDERMPQIMEVKIFGLISS